MPRRYRLGERQASVDATRARIVDAAVALYTEIGISRTTTRAIGERADVAPGTLRHHFPTRDALDAAVVERLQVEVPLPDRSIFEGADGVGGRVTRLIEVGARFLEQGAPWYRMWLREPMLAGPWRTAGAAYGARWDALFREALGPLADDAEAMILIRSVLQVRFLEDLRADGRSRDEAVALLTSVVVPWFEARLAARDRRSRSG